LPAKEKTAAKENPHTVVFLQIVSPLITFPFIS
jgi:hypothetical protein